MSRAPWFKFFAGDYMSSPFVQALDPEQELWYLRLIIASAISLPRGCLPLANGKLWRLAKAPSLEHFEKHCELILSKFEKDEASGLYRVTKIANQLIGNGELSGKRSEAGKKGAATRWQVPSVLPSTEIANAIEHPWQNMADSDSDSDSDSDTTTTTTASSQQESLPDNSPPPGGRRKASRKRTAVLSAYPEAVSEVVNKILALWPGQQPNGEKIRTDVAAFASRVDQILRENEDASPELLIHTAEKYLTEQKRFYRAPQFFFGPGNGTEAPWVAYARMIVHQTSKSEVAGGVQ